MGLEFPGVKGKQAPGDDPIKVHKNLRERLIRRAQIFVNVPRTVLPCKCSGECKLHSLGKKNFFKNSINKGYQNQSGNIIIYYSSIRYSC